MKLNTEVHVSDGIKSMIWKIVYFTVLAIGIVLAYIAFTKSQVPVFIFGVLPCGLILGFLSVKLWLPKIGNFIGFGFLFPRKYLKKAPLMLSPYWGMLSREDYAGMLSGLIPLLREHPEHPDVVYLYAFACMNSSGYESAGFAAMEQHFALEERDESVNHAKLLFYYVEKAYEYQKTDLLEGILIREYQSNFYTDSEKRMIEIRLRSVRRI